MKVRLSVSRTAALKAGKDRHGHVVVEVPASSLTEAQRETLSRCRVYNTPEEIDFDLSGSISARNFGRNDGVHISLPEIAEATPECVPQLLDFLAAKIEEMKAEDAARQVARQAELDAWCALPIEERIENNYGTWRPNRTRDLEATPAYKEAAAECDKRNALTKAQREREEDEKKAKKEAGKVALRNWAETHGSDLLKARIAEGFEFEGLAQKEFASSIVEPLTADFEESAKTPDGYELDEFQARTTPTLEEIQALRTLRQRFEGKPVAVDLKWAKYDPKEDEDGYFDDDKPEQLQRAELVVTVTCPNGAEREFYFLPATAKTADAK